MKKNTYLAVLIFALSLPAFLIAAPKCNQQEHSNAHHSTVEFKKSADFIFIHKQIKCTINNYKYILSTKVDAKLIQKVLKLLHSNFSELNTIIPCQHKNVTKTVLTILDQAKFSLVCEKDLQTTINKLSKVVKIYSKFIAHLNSCNSNSTNNSPYSFLNNPKFKKLNMQIDINGTHLTTGYTYDSTSHSKVIQMIGDLGNLSLNFINLIPLIPSEHSYVIERVLRKLQRAKTSLVIDSDTYNAYLSISKALIIYMEFKNEISNAYLKELATKAH